MDSLIRSRRCRTAAYLFVVMTICVLIISQPKFDSSSAKWNGTGGDGGDLSSSEFNPTVDDFVNHTDVIWQIPGDSPKAVLFIAHGCTRRATDFWDKSSRCPRCTGLPEERLVVLETLRRGYAVLVISSLGTCWSLGNEVGSVEGIIRWWMAEHQLQKLPIVGLGVSSGVQFLSILAARGRLNSEALRL